MRTATPAPEEVVSLNALDEQRQLVKDGLLGISETASFLGVQRSTVYNLIGVGQLPVVKVGRRTLIPKAAVVAYAASHLREQRG